MVFIMNGKEPLKNVRHELFVQYLIQKQNASDAYVLAGYKPDRTNAARLTTNDHIVARKQYLLSLTAKSTVADVLELLESATNIVRDERKTPVTAKEQLIAGDQIAKLRNFYPPEKHVNVNLDVQFKVGRGYVEEEEVPE